GRSGPAPLPLESCGRCQAGTSRCRSYLRRLPYALAAEPAEVVVRRAGSLGRDHAGSDRCLRCAGGAEYLALPWFQHPLKYLTALARLRVGDAYSRNCEEALGVVLRIRVAELQRRVVDESKATPFEVRTRLHRLVDDPQRHRIAVPRHHPVVLVFYLAPAFGQLQHQHVDGL